MVLSGGRAALAAALLLATVTGQTLPELPSGCYYTSTVITGPGSLSFSSMTMPSLVTSTSAVTVTPSSVSAPSTGPAPGIQPSDPFFIAVSLNADKSKRASVYVAFDQAGLGLVVGTKADAPAFTIDEAGNLISGAQFIGTATANGTAALQKFAVRPISPFSWALDGSSITFGVASFCVTPASQQFSVVYGGEPAPGCIPVNIAAEPGLEPSSTSNSLAGASSSTSLTGSPAPATTALVSTGSAPVSSSLSAQSTISKTISLDSTSASSTSTTRVSCSVYPSPRPSAVRRGVPFGNVSSLQHYTPPSQLSWAYNYYSLPNDPIFPNNTGPFPPPQNPFIVFYPLLFNDHPSLTSIWEANVNQAVGRYGSDAIFSFNEPDLCIEGSACMSVQQALDAYQTYIQPFAKCNVRLASPAITNAPGGFSWLEQFLGNATQRNLTVDIINIHWYASPYSMDYLQDYLNEAHRRFGGNGRPIWITEYGMDKQYDEAAVLQFVRNSTYWVEQQPWIEKSAWFGNYAKNLLNEAGTGLSPRGQLWNSYKGSGFVYGSTVPAQVLPPSPSPSGGGGGGGTAVQLTPADFDKPRGGIV